MSVSLIIATLYLIGIFAFLGFATRGTYLFYSKLGTYHKIKSDYAPCVELRNADLVDNPREYADAHHLAHDPANEDFYIESDNSDDGPSAQVVVDFEQSERRFYGEPWVTKVLVVCFYNSVATVLTSIITLSYLQLISDYFSRQLPGFYVILSIVLLISGTHLVLRLSPFLDFGIWEWDRGGNLRDSITNFGFSFNLSLLTIFFVSFFSFMVITDASEPPLISGPDLLLIFGSAVIINLVTSLFGESLLRISNVPSDLADDIIWRVDDLEIGNEE